MDNGPFEGELARMESDIFGPVVSVFSNGSPDDMALPNFGKNDAIRYKPKMAEVVVRRRRQLSKCMVELVYMDSELEAACSESSLSDGDIEHRNFVILKEAKATWEVSQALVLPLKVKNPR